MSQKSTRTRIEYTLREVREALQLLPEESIVYATRSAHGGLIIETERPAEGPSAP